MSSRALLMCGLALAVTGPILGCSAELDGPRSPAINVRVAALDLPDIDFACYDLLVQNGATTPETVISRGTVGQSLAAGDTTTLCSTRFGNGPGGDISYVAPCDSQLPNHTITLWVDGIYTGTPENPSPVDYQDPCPAGCELPATCIENADTPVTFNLTIMRPANQGFFDIGVNFDDVFCSAKVDCLGVGGQPLTLLHHPDTKVRGQTAVLGLACTTGPGDEGTVLLRDPITITCGNDVYTLDPAQPEGNVYTASTGANPAPSGSPVWQYAIYAGEEAIDCGGEPCNKVFWNVAIGFNTNISNCTLTTWATAGTAASLAELTTPEASTWPYIEVDVDLTQPGGGLACFAHPLNGDPAGVATAYTDTTTTRSFAHGFDGQTFLEPAPPGIVEDGLLMWLDAGVEASYPGSGTVWRDLSGNGNDATLVNNPGFTTAEGGGITLNGTTQYAQGAVLEPQRFTLSAWFRGTGPSSTNDSFGGSLLASNQQLAGGMGQYSINWSWASQRAITSVQANGSYSATPDGSVARNQVHYIVATYDGARRRLYHNGNLIVDDAWTTNPVYPTSGVRNLQIGRWGYPGWGRHFQGVYYQAVMYDRALTESEVLQNFNADRDRYGL
jgi:hypothetical protein